jgi:hypothetical protein
LITARPRVGSVMGIFDAGENLEPCAELAEASVLLPAPLRPIIPTTSPRWTSKETSFKAQMVSFCHELDEFFESFFRRIHEIRSKGFGSTSASRRLALSGVLGCKRCRSGVVALLSEVEAWALPMW